MGFSTADFFHEWIVPRPQINIPKYFRKYFSFRGNIYKKSFLSNQISGLLYLEVAQFLGIVTQKLYNLRVTIPGNCLKKKCLGKTQLNHSSFPFASLANFQVL